MIIKSFEDLIVWQKSRVLAVTVYKITKTFPGSERFNLTDQINRCVVSVAANIAEGFSRYHAKESVMFYRNARGSLSELKSHFYIAMDLGLITKSRFDELMEMMNEVGKLLNGLINSTSKYRS
jgi:four helix bundle protein